MICGTRRRVAVLVGALCALALGLTASPAGASLTCPNQTMEQPFVQFGDDASYTLIPGGDFEGGAPWSLAHGAAIVAGSESFDLRGPGSYSLYLPSGGVATSAPICLTLFHPNLRFVVRNTGDPGARIHVDAIAHTLLGLPLVLPVFDSADGATAWDASPIMPYLNNLLSPLTGPVQFRFTVYGSGGRFQIDDAYVDPRWDY